MEPEQELELDGQRVLLVRPVGARALYVLAHGAGAGMRHGFMRAIADALAQRGVATLRWEFPYMAAGRARPDRPEAAEAAVRDVWVAARARFGDLPMFAGGKSFGGRMTSRAHAAAALDGLRGIVLLGFPLHPADKPGIERAEHLEHAAGALLFVQGTRDELAELRRLRRVVRGLGSRATLHLIQHADHGFDVPKRAQRDPIAEVATVVVDWIERTLHATGARGSIGATDAPAGSVEGARAIGAADAPAGSARTIGAADGRAGSARTIGAADGRAGSVDAGGAARAPRAVKTGGRSGGAGPRGANASRREKTGPR